MAGVPCRRRVGQRRRRRGANGAVGRRGDQRGHAGAGPITQKKDVRHVIAEDTWRGASTLADRASVRITFTPFYRMDPESLRKRNMTPDQARRFATVHFLLRNQRTPGSFHCQLDDSQRWVPWTPPFEEAMEARRAEIPVPILVEVFQENDGVLGSLTKAETAFKDRLGDDAPDEKPVEEDSGGIHRRRRTAPGRDQRGTQRNWVPTPGGGRR